MNPRQQREHRIHHALAGAAAARDLNVTPIDLDYLTAAVLKLDGERKHFPRHPGSPLNTREIQIVTGLSRGHTNAEIARMLGLSQLTIKSHLSRIGARIGCSDRAGIVGLAYRKGWMHHLPAERRPQVNLKRHHAEVLDGIAYGLSNAAIAERLFLAEETVKSRVRALLNLLGATNRAHAVALAYQHRLLTIPTQHDRSAAA